jgi:hypothetical protein
MEGFEMRKIAFPELEELVERRALYGAARDDIVDEALEALEDAIIEKMMELEELQKRQVALTGRRFVISGPRKTKPLKGKKE